MNQNNSILFIGFFLCCGAIYASSSEKNGITIEETSNLGKKKIEQVLPLDKRRPITDGSASADGSLPADSSYTPSEEISEDRPVDFPVDI